MRLVQAEVDQCDAFAGFLILTSVAGGTGSEGRQARERVVCSVTA